ncbi:MAG: hypothetical protein K8Q99_03375 [Acholeplasmataceae bacterium]|nr:hypothetical protein [Acholeplasmataceae bacterium]
MNKKEVINIIKTKADEKQIPNLSMQILEKMENQSEYVQQETVITPIPSKTRRPVFAALTTVFALLILFLAFSVARSNSVDLFSDSNFSDSVALSAVTTLNYISQDNLLDASDSYTMLLANEETEDLVEDQIDDVMTYAHLMEVLLSNGDDYDKEITQSNLDGYEKCITFTLNTLLDEQMIYQLHYNEDINLNKETYQVEGLLVDGLESYEINIEGSFNEKQYTLTYQQNAQNYIQVKYQVENLDQELSINIYRNSILNQEIAITYNNYQKATLSFISGQTKGQYQFEIETMQNMKMMKVNYMIGQSDQGSIDFNFSDDDERNFILTIRPANRAAFIIEKIREKRENQSPGQQQNGKN